MAPAAAGSAANDRSQRWQWPRFSLRTMFALMTIAGVALAPLSYELYRARVVAQQAQVIQEMNGKYSLSPLPERFSGRLAVRLWPWRNEFLARDIQGAYFGREPHELTPLAQVPGLKRLSLNGPVTFRDPDFVHPAVTSLDISTGADQQIGSSQVEARILARFPQVEEVTLQQVPPSQSLVDDLGGCARLRSLAIIFDAPEIALVDFGPLGKLKRLRQLKVVRVARATDWSFLAELPELEEVSLSPTGSYIVGGSLPSWEELHGPTPPREQSPFHYLCDLRSLKKVELYCTPAYAADIERLLASSPIEELRIDLLPDGLDSIRALRSAKSLRRLHVSASFLGDSGDEARAILEPMQIKNLTLGPPYDKGQ